MCDSGPQGYSGQPGVVGISRTEMRKIKLRKILK